MRSSLRTTDAGVSQRPADTGAVDSGNRVPVVVQAPDPISRAGVRSQLAQHPVINLLDSAEAGPGTVAVLVNEDRTRPRCPGCADSYAATGRVPCWW